VVTGGGTGSTPPLTDGKPTTPAAMPSYGAATKA
jgi:hypothetical protein